MALIRCKECGEGVSSKAKECPHCGAPVLSNKHIFMKMIGVVIALVAFFILVHYWSSLKISLGF